MKRIAAFIAAIAMAFSIALFPAAPVFAAKAPQDYTLTLDNFHLDFYKEYKEKEDRSRSNYHDAHIFFAMAEPGPIKIHWDGNQYTFSIPAHTFTETSHREQDFGKYYDLVETYEYPAMEFTGTDFYRNESGDIQADFLGTVTPGSSYSHEITFNSDSSDTHTNKTWFTFDDVEFHIYYGKSTMDPNPQFRLRMGYYITEKKTYDVGGLSESNETPYDHTEVYSSSFFTHGGYIDGYDFSSLMGTASEGTSSETTQNASGSAGDVAVGAVTAAVAIGLSAAAGLAGAVAGNASQNGEESDSESDDTFMLVVGKDFGDTIRKGGKPVPVRAKIIQIRGDGSETDRPDLTEAITITGDDCMQVTPSGIQNGYMTAQVSTDAETAQEQANVSFTFTGAAGVITHHLTFRLGDKPQLIFNKLMNRDSLTMEMIGGDGISYSADFFFNEAYKEPDSVTIEAPEGITVKCEPTDRMYSYHADILNNSPQQKDLFFGPQNRQEILITADFGGDDVVTGSIWLNIYPEGLCFKSQMEENGRMNVNTIENTDPKGLDEDFRPSYFEAMIAYSEEGPNGAKAVIVPPEKVDVQFGELDAPGALKETFEYKTGQNSSSHSYYVQAKCTLPSLDGKPFDAALPLTAEANGRTYEAQLPLALIGLKPDPAAEWEDERKLLLKAIQTFGLANNEYLREQIRKAKSLSAKELRMIRYAIAKEAAAYYTKEGDEFTSLEASLGRYEFTFSCVKWIADQAFSYMVTLYGGGPTVEAFATPFKDLIGEFLGQLTASAYWGTEVQMTSRDLGKTVAAGIENTISNQMGDCMSDIKNVNIKKLGGLCACFLMISFLKHFYGVEEEERDAYDSLLAAFNDMTTGVLKNAFAAKVSDLLKNNQTFGNTLQEFLNKHLAEAKMVDGFGQKVLNESADIAGRSLSEKYLTETLGLVVTNVSGNVLDAAGKVATGKIDKDLFDFKVSVGDSEFTINVVKSMEGIVNLLWEKTLKIFCDTAKPIKSQEIPPYYREA